MLRVDIERDDEGESPQDRRIRSVVAATLRAADGAADPAQDGGQRLREICLRIVGEGEMRALNARYRGRDYATNVLSFPADLPADLDLPLLGDIAICATVVAREAEAQHKTLAAHWDHMVVHGVLHLLGHDHERPAEADIMEAIERRVLAEFGWPDPYLEPAAAMTARPACEANAQA